MKFLSRSRARRSHMRPIRLLSVFALSLALGALGMTTHALAADDPAPKPLRALLVLGGCCHDYAAQKDILAKGISERARVSVVIAYDSDRGTQHLNPIYQNPDWAAGYDVVIHDECCSDVKDLELIDRILAPHRHGLPSVVLHCGMHCYRSAGWPKAVTPWFEFTGLQTTAHAAQEPIAVTFLPSESPITHGLANWKTIREELYNNYVGKLLDTATPLARGKQTTFDRRRRPTTSDSVVVWTNNFHGTKVFATTLGHNNETVSDPRYLDLVTRGLLWSCGKLNPHYLK
jgi:type 1 glutamine amidotransferase